VAEIDDFDIDRSTAQAWAEFQSRLGEVLSMMDDSADLTIGTEAVTEQGGPWLRFSSPRRDVLRCEAAGNATLGEDFQLEAEDLAALEALGWQPPSADGPADFWIERPQEEFDAVAEMAVAALRDVYGVQHPVFLAPDQLAEVLHPAPVVLEQPAALAADDLMAVVPTDRNHLDALVDAELTDMFGHSPLRDTEGDVAIRVGSTMLFLRSTPDAREVVVFAAVVHDVSGRSRAAEILNDMNVEARWVKFQLIRDRVFVTTSVQARPFVPAHLQQAVQVVSQVADGVDEDLAAKLNGRTTFTGHEDS
jgi:hypothetical protein